MAFINMLVPLTFLLIFGGFALYLCYGFVLLILNIILFIMSMFYDLITLKSLRTTLRSFRRPFN